MATRYCPVCKRNVEPQDPKVNPILLFIPPVNVFYLPYLVLFKKQECPFCGNTKFERAHLD